MYLYPVREIVSSWKTKNQKNEFPGEDPQSNNQEKANKSLFFYFFETTKKPVTFVFLVIVKCNT
jgi:hypothetical protein